MNKSKKEKGYDGEKIALNYYLTKGYKLILQNRTIPGGEIDLILQNDEKLLFIEVKNIIYIDDIHNYITPRKLQVLKRAIETYTRKFPTQKLVSLDIVFVKNDKIYEIYENVEV